MRRHLGLARARDERGAVAIVVAVIMTLLLVVVALVLDFGLVRVDRHIDRAAADEATLAGLHALNQNDGKAHPYVGVCAAVRYLKANSERFAAASESSGWKNGLGATPTPSDGCSAALTNVVCSPTDKSTWAKWAWSGNYRGAFLSVTIESGYDLAANNTWREDTLPATIGDVGDNQGCDNLAVTIQQSRKPGLGTLATASDLSTGIRSVGRVRVAPGDAAPAMLLLKRTGCPVLVTGSNTSPATSFIKVLGAVSADGTKAQAGTIHSDSDGLGCSGGNDASRIFNGRGASGIVTYAAPLISNPLLPDPSKPGVISAVAVHNGITGLAVRDSLDNVYASSLQFPLVATKGEVTGRPLVTRRYVDERYFPAVKTAIGGTAANPGGAVGVFNSGAAGAPPGWTNLAAGNACKPTQAEVNTAVNTAILVSGGKLYINCTANNGFQAPANTPLSIGAPQVYFAGVVNPGSTLKFPNASKIYVGNHGGLSDAIAVGNGSSFEVNTAGNVDLSGNCTTGVQPSRAVLFVRAGQLKQTGGLVQMCRTTGFILGGMTGSSAVAGPGCVPLATGIAPTMTPCNGGLGTGQVTMSGSASIDWTAPNTLDATTDANGNTLPAAAAAWARADGPEDLALWSESGTSSSSNFSMGGSGTMRVRGVFMVPNAAPFTIGGGTGQILTNAQYIATSIELNGAGTAITMKVDPNSAVTVPDLRMIGLVR